MFCKLKCVVIFIKIVASLLLFRSFGMLEFYYDFLDKYIDRKDFELIQMDTDSSYMAISGEKLDYVVGPELREEFEADKKNWLAWDKWSGRTPWLFKL